MPKIIAIDIDGTIADLHTVWLNYYNKDYGDNLMINDITDWNMHLLVKPECGKHIYDYLSLPDLYIKVKPIDGALENIEKLRFLGHKIFFATSCAPGSWGMKYDWLINNKFIKDVSEYMEVNDKSLIRADYLVDDYWENLNNFYGYPILFARPWNTKYQFDSKYLHVNSWKKIIKYFK